MVPVIAHAQDWGSLATISTTMGINEGRLCLGESTRGDLGCPTYTPTVTSTGLVGIGTPTPASELHVIGGITISRSAVNPAAFGLRIGPTIWQPDIYFSDVTKGSDIYFDSHGYMSADGNIYQNIMASSTTPNGNAFVWGAFRPARTGGAELMRLTDTGRLGISTTNPQTALHVVGSLRLGYETSAALNTCDANRTGAIKYQSGDFHYCRNGTSWESLTSLTGGGGSAGDRITSGTTGVYTYTSGKASIATAGTERIVINNTGLVGIGQQPQTGMALAVSGSAQATTLKLADNPAETCGPTTYGTIKIINGRQYTCRP